MTQLILMPTLHCNAGCDYCFQEKRGGNMDHSRLTVLLEKLADYMDAKQVEQATIYWLGGEPLTLGPDWFLTAWDIVRETELSRNKRFVNRLQTNLMAYTKQWNRVILEMFGGQVGSSLDYPNLFRRFAGGGTEDYNTLWLHKFREASDSGIDVGVISIPNHETLRRGAKEYFEYYREEIGVGHVLIYPPLYAGTSGSSALRIHLDTDKLGDFYRDMVVLWSEQEYARTLSISPFDQLQQYFLEGDKSVLPCEMKANCADKFFCCDPSGNVMQCDCWTNFPQFRYGNIFSGSGLSEIFASSAIQMLRERPLRLIRNEECLECLYLTVCHGGCPARALGMTGDLFRKDPYCVALKAMFEAVEEASRNMLQHTDNRGQSVAADRP